MRGWLFVVVALVVAVVGFGALKQASKRPEITSGTPAPAAIVRVEAAAFRVIAAGLAITGSISAKDELSIGAEASGLRIDEVPVEEGDIVHKGQLLARLNSSVMQAQLAALEARYQSSQAQIRKAIQPNRPLEISQLALAVRQAETTIDQEVANLNQTQASLSNAEKNVARYRESLAEGYVTAQETETRFTDADRFRAQVRGARERVESARFAAVQAREKLKLAQEGGRSEDVEIARASAQEIAAQIQQMRAQLDQAQVLAPDEGLITQRDAHLGDISSPSKVLFKMVRRNQLELRAQVPEQELPRVHVGQVADLTFNGKKIKARVWMVSPQVDPQTRLGEVRLSLPLHSGLKTGMFVGGQLEMGTRRALTIPTRAVTGEAGKQSVMLLVGDKVQKRTIEPGVREGDRLEVVKGLEAGEKVVVDGSGFLNDGDLVDVKP